MISHSASKRSLRAYPELRPTIFIQSNDTVAHRTADKPFMFGNVTIEVGEVYCQIQSPVQNRYYIVHFDKKWKAWQCSCGANHGQHEHIEVAKNYLRNQNITSLFNNVVPVERVEMLSTQEENIEAVVTSPLTREDWKAIMKRDKERQKQEKAADMAKIYAAREEAKRIQVGS